MIPWSHELPSPDARARLAHVPGWLTPEESAVLLARLEDEVPLAQRSISLFGRQVLEPRLTAWVGDPGAVYTYSGRRHAPVPFGPALSGLRARLEAALERRFDSVLVNLYRSGDDAMGMHADDELELGPEPLIASVSLGAARTFRVRPRRAADPRGAGGGLDLRLRDGDLLVMGGSMQEHHRHGVPREAGAGRRMNLTFRWIRGPKPH